MTRSSALLGSGLLVAVIALFVRGQPAKAVDSIEQDRLTRLEREVARLSARVDALGATVTELRRAEPARPSTHAVPMRSSVPKMTERREKPEAQKASPAPQSSQATLVETLPETREPIKDEWLPPEEGSRIFDINGDGAVNDGELERGKQLAERAQAFARNRSIDGSFPILAQDFQDGPRVFAAMDVNHDGALTEREVVTYFIQSVRELRRYDQNHDGALVLAELGQLPSRFGYLDLSGDEKIEVWEINILRARGHW